MNSSKLTARICASISFRLKTRVRQAITRFYQRKLKKIGHLCRAPNKPLSDLRLMYLTGQKQVEMLQQSLLSVEHGWSEIPRLLLVSDGSLLPDELHHSFSWWRNEVTATTWKAFAEKAAANGRAPLSQLAEKNMLGRKLCAILESARENRTLYCDTDILWFNGPPPPSRVNDRAMIQLSEDVHAMYDENLLQAIACDELRETPWLNTGVSLLSGDIYMEAGLAEIVQKAAHNPSYFTEQTITSLACKRLGGRSWPHSVIHLALDEAVRRPRATYRGQSWAARHYPSNARHLFWVDAYHLQMERGKVGEAM